MTIRKNRPENEVGPSCGNAETLCRQLGITLSYEQRAAMAALEAVGQRMLVDFSYLNCVAKAEVLSEYEMQTLFGL